MPKKIISFLLLLISIACPSFAFFECELIRDLEIVDQVNRNLSYETPIYYNHLLMAGYLNMPSALTSPDGLVNVGFSYVPPYYNANITFGLFDRVEISTNYRVFNGIPDEMLTEAGFGDKSDKGANIKVAILLPEDSNFLLPGLAVGVEDFIGTKSFESKYVVATQVFPRINLELSLGYGWMRIRRWFGGLHYSPFRFCSYSLFKDIALVAEYDSIPYKSEKREPHPDGRNTKSKINYGIKWRFYDMYDLSISRVRGDELSFSVSAYYNFGFTNGLLPKVNDPLPFRGPLNTRPLGCLDTKDKFFQAMICPFRERGLDISEAWVSYDRCNNKILRFHIYNGMYRNEIDVRNRLNDLLAYAIPSDIDQVVVVVESESFSVHEYHYCMKYVENYRKFNICPYELSVISPLCNTSSTNCGSNIYKCKKSYFDWEIFPKTSTMFGSSRGKFKYALGANVGARGSLVFDWYYSVLLGYFFTSDLYDIKDVDKLNPSQIINVRTDSVNYLKQKGVTVDEAFIQRNINLSCGFFGKVAIGHFEQGYGGGALEFLYYPVSCPWAVGVEGAILKKRNFSGIGFTDKIRKLDHFQPSYKKFNGSQYFVNGYYNWHELSLDINVKAGKFLANDWGVRSELSHYYPSGFRLNFWFTYTDGKDSVNGNRYHDKGVAISIPLDIFYSQSARLKWNYGLSAWLRDVGAIAGTGDSLYGMIRGERNHDRR